MNLFERIRRKRVARAIESGKIPRGRTAPAPVKKETPVRKKRMDDGEAVLTFKAALSAKFIGKDGTVKDYGVVSRKKVTTAFANYVVDSLQDSETSPLSNFKYHDSGTGTDAEANTDTGLGTACGEARDSGTQVEGASANIYRSVATHTYSDTFAITEHGLFSASSSGTLMDRSVFSAINVVSGDSIQFTYELTVNAET